MPGPHKTIRYRGQTYQLREQRKIRGERYWVIGKYGRGTRVRERVLHDMGGGEYQDKVIHRLEFTNKRWQVLNRVQRTSLPFARISTVARDHSGLLVVMDNIEGKSLRWHLASQKQLTPFQAIRLNSQLVGQICNLIRQTGTQHSDIAPDNLIVASNSSRLVLIDFGSSFQFAETNTADPGDGIHPLYQAPEIFAGSPADRLSEQFSTAMVFYEMLTRKIAFTEESRKNWPGEQTEFQPPGSLQQPGPNQLPSSVWKFVDEYLMAALAFNPECRFATLKKWQAAARHLERLADNPNFRPDKSQSRIADWFSKLFKR